MHVLRFEDLDGGHTVAVRPDGAHLEFEPLGLPHFHRFYLGDGTLDFSVRNALATISGPKRNETDFPAKINFSMTKRGSSLEFAALMPGGWLPANVAQVDFFLPDSNVACNLGALKEDLESKVLHESDALGTGARLLSPILPAIEGNKNGFPSIEEMTAKAEEVRQKFERRFPGRSMSLTKPQILAAHGLVCENEQRWPRDRDYLRRVWPLFQMMRSKGADPVEAFRVARSERDRLNLPQLSFFYLLTLDALFKAKQRPKHWCPGDAILKPHLPPSDENLYNACSDIWILEMAMKAYALFGERTAAIVTKDRGLIGAWAMLTPRNFRSMPSADKHSMKCTVSVPDAFAEQMPAELRAEFLQEAQTQS